MEERGAADDREVEVWENQRFFLFRGWSSDLLPTDRPTWSDERGHGERLREDAVLPSNLFAWDGDWFVDRAGGDKHGWTYAFDFPSTRWSGKKGLLDYVRRRRWVRRLRKRDLVAELAQQHDRRRADSLDGLLSELRLEGVPGLHEAILETMQRYDLDGDGKLSRSEVALFLCEREQLRAAADGRGGGAGDRDADADKDKDDDDDAKGIEPPVLSKQISTGEGKCQICLVEPVNCACVPCGHLVMCMACGPTVLERTGECPICREQCSGHLHTYQ